MKTCVKQAVMALYNHGWISGARVLRLFKRFHLQDD